MDSTVRRGDQRVCAVCARVLDRYANDKTDEEHWDHSLQDQPADHPPVPVMPEQVAGHYRCDFCNDDKESPGWVIPAKDFEMPAFPGSGRHDVSDGDWAACDECAAQIIDGQWGALINRLSTLAAARSKLPRDHLAVELARIYHRLRLNMTGPPRKIQGG